MGNTLLWLLLIECFGVSAFPLAVRIFPKFPDSGLAFAKPIAFLLLAYCAWILASLHLVSLSYGIFLAVAVLAVVLVLSWIRDRKTLLVPFEQCRADIAVSEGVFLVVFILLGSAREQVFLKG